MYIIDISAWKHWQVTIFTRKILHLKIENRLWFFIKEVILKQTPLNVPSECSLNGISILLACKQIDLFIEWMMKIQYLSRMLKNIYNVLRWRPVWGSNCMILFLKIWYHTVRLGPKTDPAPMFQTPENTFILFIFHVSFGEEKTDEIYS